jgi:hypothetical protein
VFADGRPDCQGRKPVKRFKAGHNAETGCVLDFTHRGGLLVSRCSQSTAEEFDLAGISLWRTPRPVAPGVVTGVRNGHFMVAVFSGSAVVELDRLRKIVWRHEVPGFSPFLARKR